MTPIDLAEYLRVLREAKVMQAGLEIEGLRLSVSFGPEEIVGPPPSGLLASEPEPGGWKRGAIALDEPQDLDAVVGEP